MTATVHPSRLIGVAGGVRSKAECASEGLSFTELTTTSSAFDAQLDKPNAPDVFSMGDACARCISCPSEDSAVGKSFDGCPTLDTATPPDPPKARARRDDSCEEVPENSDVPSLTVAPACERHERSLPSVAMRPSTSRRRRSSWQSAFATSPTIPSATSALGAEDGKSPLAMPKIERPPLLPASDLIVSSATELTALSCGVASVPQCEKPIFSSRGGASSNCIDATDSCKNASSALLLGDATTWACVWEAPPPTMPNARPMRDTERLDATSPLTSLFEVPLTISTCCAPNKSPISMDGPQVKCSCMSSHV
mmetsp:Transcript_63602/g.165170  ORF Transcript_63602/g.165170 Transcript_63602/m.165170 type:complete len:310 (+) Transcript_63602:178-1107(+)